MATPLQAYQKAMGAAERERKSRAELMPDEIAAIKMLFDAYQRLNELGWRDGMYAPRDGTTFQTISLGSTGIHDCAHTDGYWDTFDGGDIYPSSDRPDMFRLYPEDQAKADARMKKAAEEFRAALQERETK